MLGAEQRRLYDQLPARPRCFVRVCRTDDALWVSDLPRRSADWRETAQKLRGFVWRLEEASQLLLLDWPTEAWERALASLPERLPALPAREALHPAYALCRLWMLHPGARTEDGMRLLRRVVKLTDGPEQALLREIPLLHQNAAASLRKGAPCGYDAGRWLAGWLLTKEGNP